MLGSSSTTSTLRPTPRLPGSGAIDAVPPPPEASAPSWLMRWSSPVVHPGGASLPAGLPRKLSRQFTKLSKPA
ncbi:hypothetical protein MASR1M49_29920 [Pararhodobacter aggregans]